MHKYIVNPCCQNILVGARGYENKCHKKILYNINRLKIYTIDWVIQQNFFDMKIFCTNISYMKFPDLW